jgi:spore germination protein
LSTTTVGCWDQKLIKTQTFITELGLEPATDREILYTLIAPRIKTDGAKSEEVLTVQANLFRECLKKGDLFTSGTLETGKIKHLLVAEKSAQQGIQPLLAEFTRNPVQPMQASIMVVENSLHELLTKLVAQKEQLRPAFYLEQVLERGANHSYLLQSSLGNYEIAHYAPGIDPTLPMIKQIANGVTVTGTALFANDQMVGKLNPQQTALLIVMMNRLRQTELSFASFRQNAKKADSKPGIAVLITKAQRKLDLKIDHHQMELQVTPTIGIKRSRRIHCPLDYSG